MRALRAVTGVCLAALALAASAQAAPTRKSFVVPYSLDDQQAMTEGAFYYRSDVGPDQVIQRLDLTSLQTTTAYTTPRGYTVNELRAGGGRVAVQVDRENGKGRGFYGQVLELHPAGGRPTRLIGVHLNRVTARGCYRSVQLHDVSQDGAILLSRTISRCGRVRLSSVLKRFALRGRVLSIAANHLVADDPVLRLAGDWLLRDNDSSVRIRNLVTGAARTLGARSRGFKLGPLDLDAAGHVAVTDYRVRGRLTRSRLRLNAPKDPPSGGRTLVSTRTGVTAPGFCGRRLVVMRSRRPTDDLLAYDHLARQPRVVFARRHRGFAWFNCDADTAVFFHDLAAGRATGEVVPLAP